MTTDEIRARFLDYFESKDHLRQPSAPLVPTAYDPSMLLTTAGMHPLKPYFLGQEQPPHHRLTTLPEVLPDRATSTSSARPTGTSRSSRCSATSRSATTSSRAPSSSRGTSRSTASGSSPRRSGSPSTRATTTLGLGPDEEAIEAWLAIGVPRERIVLLPRSENFWQAGPIGPCGPCSELYLDRGLDFGAPTTCPAARTSASSSTGTSSSCSSTRIPSGTLTPLPAQNIDTGLGLKRLARSSRASTSIFDTDQIRPLIDLGEELSGKRTARPRPSARCGSWPTTRAA